MRRAVFLTLITVAALAGFASNTGYQRGGRIALAQPARELREFTMVAEPVRWQIQPGLVVDGWGYNGQVPGPTLRVTEDDLVRVTLINRLPAPTTIHWHGIDVPAAMDGVPGLSQEAVEPGESFRYEFVATNPGTRFYHSHVDTDTQMQLGMYGAIIIDPRTPEPVTFDRDLTYILSEKALDVTPAVAMGQADILHRASGNGRGGALQYDLFLINGRAATAIDPLTIPEGGRLRIRLVHAGNLIHTMHLHGHSFKIIATDGNPVPPVAQLLKDSVTIGPGERYDLEVDGTNPGVWAFHCHINNHAANGMSTLMEYDGARPVVDGDGGHGSHGASATLPAAGTSAPPAAITAPAANTAPPASTPSAANPHAAHSGGASTEIEQPLLDDRYSPARLTIQAGQTVSWVNNGRNLHTITSFTDLWDSGSLASGETFSFTFEKAGSYTFYCRQHLFTGMRGTITVQDR